jgi:hypothetical protein
MDVSWVRIAYVNLGIRDRNPDFRIIPEKMTRWVI